uniref:Uncharacterized protein n=1 Tax=Coccolithus braarudii TaxID=221442 RepID=A0A7S0LBH5_9EUKA|mmetsp:Transcript_3145/g.6568  ORF Transcript_3145/g.6568 Transcript_3145/m.6568 type:complete len:252 (+) Transcript_3145:13-768(+)
MAKAPRIAVAGAGGKLGILLYGMLQRLAQEPVSGIGMPLAISGTPAGARELGRGVYRTFGMAHAPEESVRFVDVASSHSWALALSTCSVALLSPSLALERVQLPPKLLRPFSLTPLHEVECRLDLDGVGLPSSEYSAAQLQLLAAQLDGAAAAGVDSVICVCPMLSEGRREALSRSILQSRMPSEAISIVGTPAELPPSETMGWTYLDEEESESESDCTSIERFARVAATAAAASAVTAAKCRAARQRGLP